MTVLFYMVFDIDIYIGDMLVYRDILVLLKLKSSMKRH